MEDHLNKLEDFERFYEMICSRICKKNEITPTGLQILYFLGHHPDRNTAKEICQMRCIKNSIASMTIDKLVRGGYIIRESDASDRRIQRLAVTEKAQPIISQGDEMLREIRDSVMADFTDEEKEQFIYILDKMHRTIKQLIEQNE